MDAIDQIIARENMSEIAATLTGNELFVVYLLVEGWTIAEIAEHLEIQPYNVHQRLKNARERILNHMPELAPAVDGRTRRRNKRMEE